MAREEEKLYGVSAFHVGEKKYNPKNSIFSDKSEVFTDGYGKITHATNKERILRLTLPDDIEGISIDEIGDDAFSDSVNLGIAILPNTVEIIGARAFFNCHSMRVISFGSSLYEIGESAFEECKALENVFLPHSLERMKARAFYGCSSLSNIKILHDMELGAMCFASCKSLEFVEILNLKVIPDGAFISSGIKKIYLSNSIEHIGISAFSGCNRLEAIYFDGSLEEFRKIYFGMNWNKNIPSSCALFIRDSHGKYYDAFKKREKREEEPEPEIKEGQKDKDLELLGISIENPTLSDISKAYREKARRFHPDVLSGLDLDSAYTEFASNRFREYTEAYERLIRKYK